MIKGAIRFLLIFVFYAVLTFAFSCATIITYSAPSGGIPLSSDFTVTANGQHVDVYQVKVPPQWIGYTPCPSSYEIASMAYFDFSGTVHVQITSSRAVSSVVVRPLRHGISPSVNGDTISFSLSQPLNLSIEINDDDRHNLHLFANPMEMNWPSPSDPNVKYYRPGVHGDGSRIFVNAGETVYIAGGAVVHGAFYYDGKGGNVNIRGRGIVSGERFNNNPCVRNGGHTMISARGLDSLNLEGFIVLDSPAAWTFLPFNISSFTADNVKAISWRGNADGVDITSVSSANVKNSFIRSTDDIFAIKADPYFLTPSNRSTENVVIENSVGWADGAGHAIAFMEQSTPYMRNIQFKSIDILHSYVDLVWFERGTNVYDVTMDDVRVEDMLGSNIFLMEGTANNVYINNFSVLGGSVKSSVISGSVSNVTFNNLNYLGQNILSASAGQFTIGSNVTNINFTSGGSVPPTATPTPTPPPPFSAPVYNNY